MPGRAEWHTPINALKNREEVWSKLEETCRKAPKVPLSPRINYFNTQLKQQDQAAEYDLFFSYTKSFPLWDPKKPKDNCRNQALIHENIYNQERGKAVPVLTSHYHGLPTRPLLDQPETAFRRITATKDFKRRRGVKQVEEKEPQ